jgi:hypothetical protein
MAPPVFSAAQRRALDGVAQDFERIFAERFVAFVAYGHGSSLAFTSTVTHKDLEACAVLVETWHRQGLATPLLTTPEEFRCSLDVFPLEYQSILDAHVVIAGVPPFAGASVPTDELRSACEVQAKGHLIHLRQACIESGGHTRALAAKVAASAAPLRALLMSVARLSGSSPTGTTELATFAAGSIGLPRDLVERILKLETDPADAMQMARRVGEYLAATERLWMFVDTWHA